jgi:hypothetical protein
MKDSVDDSYYLSGDDDEESDDKSTTISILHADVYGDDEPAEEREHSRRHSHSQPLLRGMNLLDLSFAAGSKEPLYDPQCRAYHIQEQEVLVLFDLPDGSQGEHRFKLGQTVEVLKSFVESEYGIPMQEQELYLDDKLLLNPFSLLDYPGNGASIQLCLLVEMNI